MYSITFHQCRKQKVSGVNNQQSNSIAESSQLKQPEIVLSDKTIRSS